MSDPISEPTSSAEKACDLEVPEGMRRAKAALRRDLPALLANRRTRRKWVAYGVDGQIAIGTDFIKLIEECVKRGIPDDEFIIDRVTPGAGSDEEEEIDSFFV